MGFVQFNQNATLFFADTPKKEDIEKSNAKGASSFFTPKKASNYVKLIQEGNSDKLDKKDK
ncbi:hypothetical protein J40TS1_00510 [Paenibacillus montaniterrae]|uniref:Uncharacterized protein n=1 Tax=Paenibacillus montaniterrae TaxID=429341 RepID=A0A920CWU9_9BACL|nr:hypothetical protein [Paenibacillus montaniterrae]GIP14409.1 hypothetical protein J40TS1_00510 [Paenibacillus montaniterrae]